MRSTEHSVRHLLTLTSFYFSISQEAVTLYIFFSIFCSLALNSATLSASGISTRTVSVPDSHEICLLVQDIFYGSPFRDQTCWIYLRQAAGFRTDVDGGMNDEVCSGQISGV